MSLDMRLDMSPVMRPPARAVRRSPRGQSVVELALALLIFVSVAMLGIHFAEVGYLPIKVHEAAVSPLWDSTALRVHKWRAVEGDIGDFTPFPVIPSKVEANANARYHDFDGRSSTPGAGDTSVTQVFTRIQDMLVRCRRNDDVEFDLPHGDVPPLVSPTAGGFPEVPAGGPPANTTFSVLTGLYENMGGVACDAEARLDTLPSLPTRFLDQGSGGFFNTPNAKRFTMKVCAVGRATKDGECKGRFGVLLGDWAFADDGLEGNCPLQPELPDVPCSSNRTLYLASKTIFARASHGPWREATKFAKHFAGFSPIDENGFFMSYRGEEDNYVETLTPKGEEMDEKLRPYNTGGVENKPSPVRRKSNTCFLGLAEC